VTDGLEDWLARSPAFRAVCDGDSVRLFCPRCLSAWLALVGGPPASEGAVRALRRRQRACLDCLAHVIMET